MKPVEFPQTNSTFAKNQDEYLNLPAYWDPDGVVVSCWKMGLFERLKILFTGRLWLHQLTFNEPLQPMRPTLEYPFLKDKDDA